MSENQSNILEFEEKVRKNLSELSVNFDLMHSEGSSIGVAVSGGADSVSLLAVLSVICSENKVPLNVITINHFIRSDAETYEDSDYVDSLVSDLKAENKDIKLYIKNLEKGAVFNLSKEKKIGIEAAARFLRYEAFDTFCKDNNIKHLCLAHNKNDNLETILMRFLQGSSKIYGISNRRSIYCRPLLNISRSEIESYLKAKKIKWKTDSTNFDTNYLRNRVRHKLVPVLDNNFFGWQKSITCGSVKSREDEDFFDNYLKDFNWEKYKDGYSFPIEKFKSFHIAVKRRFLYKGFALINIETRFSFSAIYEFFRNLDSNLSYYKISSGDIEISFDSNYLYVKNKKIMATDYGFFAIIDAGGVYEFPFGSVSVKVFNGFAEIDLCSAENNFSLKEISIPFCIRSRQLSDFVQTSSFGKKSVSDVLSDWKVPHELKNALPIIQELSSPEQKIRAVAGSLFGFDNWIVL